jgi:hypothetical protein
VFIVAVFIYLFIYLFISSLPAIHLFAVSYLPLNVRKLVFSKKQPQGSISNDSQTTPNDIATPLQQSLSEARLQQRAEVVKRIAENSSHSDRYARFTTLSFLAC